MVFVTALVSDPHMKEGEVVEVFSTKFESVPEATTAGNLSPGRYNVYESKGRPNPQDNAAPRLELVQRLLVEATLPGEPSKVKKIAAHKVKIVR